MKTLKDVIAEVLSLQARVAELEAKLEKAENRRGPKSEREMTDDDARKILKGGEFANLSHKDAAEKLSLSYAQVYSCRKEFTFKHIHKELRDAPAQS